MDQMLLPAPGEPNLLTPDLRLQPLEPGDNKFQAFKAPWKSKTGVTTVLPSISHTEDSQEETPQRANG